MPVFTESGIYQCILNLRNFSLYSLQCWKTRLFISSNLGGFQCVESVRIWCFSGPYFLVFSLNTERYSISFQIQSEWGKICQKNSGYGPLSRSVFTFHFFYSQLYNEKEFVDFMAEWWKLYAELPAQKIKFSIKDVYSK